MSIDANPSIKEIATTFGDTPPYSMSELYGLNFSSGNAVASGTIRLSEFRNKTVEFILDDTKILASDGEANDNFGRSVSISNDGSTAIVGADRHNSRRGAAYIFEKVNGVWTQMAKLTASDGLISDNFGQHVSISNDGSTALVGAIGDDTSTGSAYIFEKGGSGWSNMTQTAKLTASDGVDYDRFGRVSISNDGSTTAIMGAGAVYIFEKGVSGWSNTTETAKLTASGAGLSASISNDGSMVIMGATGAAYIFEKGGSGWSSVTETAELTASDGVSSDEFGQSVSISNDGSTALVGAYGDDSSTGSAYIFEKGGSGWSNMTETAKLTASDGLGGDYLGHGVSISGDGTTAVLGAYRDGSSTGSAYIFDKGGSGWSNMTETTKLTAYDGQSNDQFGYSVSISNDGSTTIVGAYKDDVSSKSERGSAYIYEKTYFVN